uniref:Carboxypeptidase n=1 Tax=Amblyomma maculatum TaxID=34609 RepID=G3MM89_AMBMU
MKYVHLWTLLPLVCSVQADSGYTDSGPLFLSPLIRNGSIAEAKNRSTVTFFKYFNVNASAYSGYITVNNNSSNLFFLFVEAEQTPKEAPLMLWTQGGPGLSALFGLFLQNGPVKFDVQYNGSTPIPSPSRRELTIQSDWNVIYLDAPVGAGFSFTASNSSYATKLENITSDIVEFLQQFLVLFSEYEWRDFYAAGDSYAARYSVALADYMLRCPGIVNLTFQGTIGGVGFLAPILELADSSDFLYQVSMLDKKGYGIFKQQFENIRNITRQGQYDIAIYMLAQTIFAYQDKKTLFQNLTFYNNHASPLYSEMPLSMLLCFKYINSSDFKTALHVGENTVLQYDNPLLLQRLAGDFLVDITKLIEHVLNKTRVLFYTGQLDALFPSTNLQAYFDRLNWTKANEYRDANRSIWRPYGPATNAAGYMKSAGNFTSAVMLGMGHYAGFDKPTETYLLMKEFLDKNISFSPQ